MNKNTSSNLYNTPYTNRGVIRTIKGGSFLLFDWVQATIFCDYKNYSIYDLFFSLFGVNRLEVLFDEVKPLFGYSHCYSYRHLYIFTSDNEDMGYHIYLTGTGCRDFEELGLSYDDLFDKIFRFKFQFTRVDVSIDDFTGRLFSLTKVKNCLYNHEVVSRFRSSIQFIKDDLGSLNNIGHTIWFGSRASDIQFVFYDKLKERVYNANVDIDEEIKFWNRLELRFRNNKADNVILNYMWCSDFNKYIIGIINNYLSFRIKSSSDTNRRRWELQPWWKKFVADVPAIHFQTIPVEYNITKKRSWLDYSCSYSAFAVLISDIQDLQADEVFSRFLYEFFSKGSKKLSEHDLQLINQYRIKNKLNPISYDEVSDFIKSIKDFIILK